MEKISMEKIALTAAKAHAMADAAGIVTDGQWKHALRAVRGARGELLAGKELAKAKERLGKMPNNVRQNANSLFRREGGNKEVLFDLKQNHSDKMKVENSLSGDQNSVLGLNHRNNVAVHEGHFHPYEANKGYVLRGLKLYKDEAEPLDSTMERAFHGGHEMVYPSGMNYRGHIDALTQQYKGAKKHQDWSVLSHGSLHDHINSEVFGDLNYIIDRSQKTPGYRHTIYSPETGHESVTKARPWGIKTTFFKNKPSR